LNVLIHAIEIEGLVDFARAKSGAILQSAVVVPLDVIGITVPREPSDYAGCRRRACLRARAFGRVSNQEKNAKSNQRSSKGVICFHILGSLTQWRNPWPKKDIAFEIISAPIAKV
jgi:hypothetical protein